MNLINDRALARRFKAKAVPSQERLCYFLILLILLSIFMSHSFIAWMLVDTTGPTEWDFAGDLVDFVINVVGIIVVYQVNARGDDREFLERFICLNLPAGVQSIAVFILLMLLFGAAYALFIPPESLSGTEEIPEAHENIIFLITLFFTELFLYYRLYTAMRIASGAVHDKS